MTTPTIPDGKAIAADEYVTLSTGEKLYVDRCYMPRSNTHTYRIFTVKDDSYILCINKMVDFTIPGYLWEPARAFGMSYDADATELARLIELLQLSQKYVQELNALYPTGTPSL